MNDPDDSDIELIMAHLGGAPLTRVKIVDALKKTRGDILAAIMKLSSPQNIQSEAGPSPIILRLSNNRGNEPNETKYKSVKLKWLDL